jgi:methyl-accepting chemotaxis protein
MKWFANLAVARKLALGFGACLVVAALLGALALAHMTHLGDVAQEIARNPLPKSVIAAHMTGSARQVRTREFQHLLEQGDEGKAKYDAGIAEAQSALQGDFDAYAKTPLTDKERTVFETFKSSWTSYSQMNDRALALSHQRHTGEALKLLNGDMKKLFHSGIEDPLTELSGFNEQYGQSLARQAVETSRTAALQVTTLLIAMLALGSLAAYAISRNISHSLKLMAKAADGLAQGDLDQKITLDTREETGQLANSLRTLIDYQNEMARIAEAIANGDLTGQITPRSDKDTLGHAFAAMNRQLRTLIGELSESAEAVTTASGMLAGSSRMVSESAAEVSASMNEISSASEQSARGASEIAHGSETAATSLAQSVGQLREMMGSVQSVAQDADAAKSAGTDATRVTGDGARTVARSIESMQGVQKSVSRSADIIQGLGAASGQIGAIVKTIDDIASQTNLLALNAAIEAARAGESGRGFAVVADEVRKLAERSGVATKEIASLISDVQERTKQAVQSMEEGTRDVEASSALAAEAGSALTKIERGIQIVSQRVEEICAASGKMTQSAEQVNQAIGDVSAVMEQSSAATEELCASAEEVSASIEMVAEATQRQQSSVEDLASASRDLSGVARQLQDTIARFRLEEQAPQMKLRMAA